MYLTVYLSLLSKGNYLSTIGVTTCVPISLYIFVYLSVYKYLYISFYILLCSYIYNFLCIPVYDNHGTSLCDTPQGTYLEYISMYLTCTLVNLSL